MIEEKTGTQALGDYCDRVLNLKNARLGDEYFYQSLPLCVLDAVFSIGVKYEGTRQVVIRYCDYFKLNRIRDDKDMSPPHSAQESIMVFLNRIDSFGIDQFASEVLRNRQRTSPRNGILKSQAVRQFSNVLKRHKVDYLQDIPNAYANEKMKMEIRDIPGQGSGISLKYFFMLSGSEDLIKPDRHIKDFIQEAIDKRVNDDDAQELLHGTCIILREKHNYLTPRLLDYTIWNYQRKNRRT